MGEKGSKLTGAATGRADWLVGSLADIGDINSKKMFGGYGIFCRGTMFGLINSEGEIFFKAGDQNNELFEKNGSNKHGRMPYFSVPESILEDNSKLRQWADLAIEVAEA